jgi:hypothetical protein
MWAYMMIGAVGAILRLRRSGQFLFFKQKSIGENRCSLNFLFVPSKIFYIFKNPTFFSPEQMSQVSEKSTKNVRAETGRKTGKQPFILQ